MPSRNADVIIVGGGVTGVSTALNLKLRGIESVVVLERHHIGAGQSGRAAGVVRALVRDPLVSRWLLESIRFFSSFTEQFGERMDVNDVGYLLLASTEEKDQVEATSAASASAGCEVRSIDAKQAQELQPGLRCDDQTIYAFEPSAIYVDPMVATRAMARAARRSGVQILEGCEVGSIQVNGNAVTGVQTADVRWDAPVVMIATSVWGKAQLSVLDVDVPVYPHRAEMAFFHAPLEGNDRCQRILSDTRSMLYLRPQHVLQMFVGWREGDRISGLKDLTHEDPDNYKQTAHYETVQDMHRRLAMTLPFMRDGFVHGTYACVYDYTLDAMPILDQVDSISGLYFALGFSGGGFSMSPWIGRMMAEFILTANKPSDIDPLRLSRFAEGELIDWSNVSHQKTDTTE